MESTAVCFCSTSHVNTVFMRGKLVTAPSFPATRYLLICNFPRETMILIKSTAPVLPFFFVTSSLAIPYEVDEMLGRIHPFEAILFVGQFAGDFGLSREIKTLL